MDYNQYYLDQAKGSIQQYQVFRGSPFQRGYGLGNAFKRFFTWAIPLLKQYAMPIAKNVGKEIVNNVANVANDAIEGKNIKDSVKDRIQTSLEKLKNQKGSGKRKRKQKQNIYKKSKKQRTLDIFD